MAQILDSEVLNYVDASTVIQFDLSKKRGVIQHTAIALSFDGIPIFTLDYYPKNDSLPSRLAGSSSASAGVCAALATNSDIWINQYHSSVSNIERRLLRFMIDTVRGRRRAISLLKELAAIDMGEFHTFCNNCRHFVSKAIDVLCDNEEKYAPSASTVRVRNGGQREIQRIHRNDQGKVVLAGVLVSALLGAVAYGIYSATQEDSDSD